MNGTDCGINSLCVIGLESVGVGGIKNRVVVSQKGNMILVKVGDLKNYRLSSTVTASYVSGQFWVWL